MILLNGYICDAATDGSVVVSKGCYIDKNSRIGKYTFINTNCTITKAEIGNYCSIGSNVVIGPGQHHLDNISISGHFYNDGYEELTREPVSIGHDVWIGTYAIVMRGVSVGTGAVIGAGAIVTKDVPDYAVVVGVPAKFIKYRFDIERQNQIKQTRWFDLDKEAAMKTIRKLENGI